MGTTMRSPTNNSRKVLSLDRLNIFLLLLTIFSFYSAVWMFQLAHPSPSYNHQLELKRHLEDRPTPSSSVASGIDNNNNKEREDIDNGARDTLQQKVDNNYNDRDDIDKEHNDDIVDNETLDKLFVQDGTREVSDIISDTLDTLQKKHPSYKETPKEEQLALKDEVLKHLLKMKERRAKQLQSISPSNKPPDWETYGFYKTRHYFQCKEHAHKLYKPLPTIEYWNELKDAYRKYVDDNIDFDESVSPVDGYNFDGEGSPQPYYAGHGSRGRGLFASRDIKQGELVHDGTKSDYLFDSKEQWLRLVYNLPREMACDLIDWSWTAQSEKGGPFKLFSAINISILMNGSDENEQNVNPPNEYTSKMYALRDIKKGEELLFDYDIYETAWDEVDLDDDDEDSLYDDDDNEWKVDDKLHEENEIEEEEENRGEVMLESVPVKLIRGRSKFQ